MYSFIGVRGFGLRHPTAGDDHECLNYQSADTHEYSYDQRKQSLQNQACQSDTACGSRIQPCTPIFKCLFEKLTLTIIKLQFENKCSIN